jgi:hypothetical protein
MEGSCNDITQKVVDVGGTLEIQQKTQAEIDRDNPKPPIVPIEDQQARITNKQLDALLARITALEQRP